MHLSYIYTYIWPFKRVIRCKTAMLFGMEGRGHVYLSDYIFSPLKCFLKYFFKITFYFTRNILISKLFSNEKTSITFKAYCSVSKGHPGGLIIPNSDMKLCLRFIYAMEINFLKKQLFCLFFRMDIYTYVCIY